MKQANALLIGLLAAGLWTGGVHANEFAPQIKAHLDAAVRPWLKDPVVIEAIKRQNIEHAALDQGKIDALDKQWRAEAKAGGGPLIAAVDKNPASAFLKAKQAAGAGVYGEIFVMDSKGLNVGQTAATSDYWQADEAKFQKTFAAGAGAVFIDEVEFDESAGAFFAQASLTIADPQTGEKIGAVTLGVQVENLVK